MGKFKYINKRFLPRLKNKEASIFNAQFKDNDV